LAQLKNFTVVVADTGDFEGTYNDRRQNHSRSSPAAGRIAER
jgi:hypothetical protein